MRRRPRKQSLPPQLMLSPMIDFFAFSIFYRQYDVYERDQDYSDQAAGGAEFGDGE